MSTVRISRCFAIFLGVFLVLAGSALAGRVTVHNKSGYDIFMSFMFYDHERDYYYVRGWFKVPAGEKLFWNFPIAPDKKFYWYGKTNDGKRHWPGEGDKKQAVINKPMNLKYDVVKTYSTAYNANFATRSTNADGDILISIVN